MAIRVTRHALVWLGCGVLAMKPAVDFTRQAHAAVRICKDLETSGPVFGSNEPTARAAALAIWKSKALVYGEPYSAWRIASDRLLTCLPKREGGYECLASARPCTIEQAPDRRENRQKRFGI